TVRSKDDRADLKVAPGRGPTLFRSLSPLRFDEPFFYGLFRDHVFVLMFAAPDGIRFSHHPAGGGMTVKRQTTNPAWDWQFIIPKYEVNRAYGFRARVAYRPRCDRGEILREVAAWRKTVAP